MWAKSVPRHHAVTKSLERVRVQDLCEQIRMIELRVDLDQFADIRISKCSYPFLPHVDVFHLRAPYAVGRERDRSRVVNTNPHGSNGMPSSSQM